MINTIYIEMYFIILFILQLLEKAPLWLEYVSNLFKPFKQGLRWTYWAIPAIGLPPMLVNLYVAINVGLNTPGSPPWALAALGIILLLVGFILSMIPEAKVNSTEEI